MTQAKYDDHGTRTLKCVICDAPIKIDTLNSTHPEAPELFQCRWSSIPWFGFVEPNTLVALCSRTCADLLLKEKA